MIADAGPAGGRFGRIRNIGRPLVGPRRIVAFLTAFGREAQASRLATFERTLNGQPSVLAVEDGRAIAAILLDVAGGQIRRIFVQSDPERLAHVGLPS
jgi:RNA polymerase sigma-70 factor, ECF subfamily